MPRDEVALIPRETNDEVDLGVRLPPQRTGEEPVSSPTLPPSTRPRQAPRGPAKTAQGRQHARLALEHGERDGRPAYRWLEEDGLGELRCGLKPAHRSSDASTSRWWAIEGVRVVEAGLLGFEPVEAVRELMPVPVSIAPRGKAGLFSRVKSSASTRSPAMIPPEVAFVAIRAGPRGLDAGASRRCPPIFGAAGAWWPRPRGTTF